MNYNVRILNHVPITSVQHRSSINAQADTGSCLQLRWRAVCVHIKAKRSEIMSKQCFYERSVEDVPAQVGAWPSGCSMQRLGAGSDPSVWLERLH